MKILLTYSSKTGNTKRVAEAICEAIREDIELTPMSNTPDPHGYDLVIVGFWIDKGRPNTDALRYIQSLNSAQTAFFFTLGAEAESDHAHRCLEKCRSYFSPNTLWGEFCCQGKISPKLIKFLKRLPSWFPHGPNKDRIARWESASTHPNTDDLKRAGEYFLELCKKRKAGISHCN